jgi:hypothetical protein
LTRLPFGPSVQTWVGLPLQVFSTVSVPLLVPPFGQQGLPFAKKFEIPPDTNFSERE